MTKIRPLSENGDKQESHRGEDDAEAERHSRAVGAGAGRLCAFESADGRRASRVGAVPGASRLVAVGRAGRVCVAAVRLVGEVLGAVGDRLALDQAQRAIDIVGTGGHNAARHADIA